MTGSCYSTKKSNEIIAILKLKQDYGESVALSSIILTLWQLQTSRTCYIGVLLYVVGLVVH